MLRLTRECRCSLIPDADPGPRSNSWGGWPTARGLTPYVAFRVTVAGAPDPRSGFLVNVLELDRLMRRQAYNAVRDVWLADPAATAETALNAAWEAVGCDLHLPTRLLDLELQVTPTLRYRKEENSSMILVTQQFEFSAAHRLHCPQWSDEENARVFGKCNYANGHGHNYVVEVTVGGEPNATGEVLPLRQIEQTVDELVINRFDHRHLNYDTAEFAELNPTVENLAQVVWNLLDGKFAPARLSAVRVYETPKTWAECRGSEGL